MKVLLINGSTRKNGCTWLALSEVAKELNTQDVETEIVQLGSDPVWDCIGCNSCQGGGHCVFEDDVVNAWIAKAREADGFVFGSPVYFAHPTGHILSVLDRMFYAGADAFLHKPGAAVVTARRAGTTASLDVLNKYFADMQMPMVGSTYWNMVFGPAPEKIPEDLEGLQTMCNLGKNMAWLLKCIQAGRETGLEPPAAEMVHWTNFNR
ncbi:MAG: flavodoxin family protein [Lawsonibacter sp.]|jgi:multimeric flavodoxin WrbA|nr:flavodoxin family protein [Lawsonibacter sp.]